MRVTVGLAVITILLLLSPCFTVKQNERTIVTNWGEVSYAAGPGIHFRVPIMQRLIPIPVNVRSVKLGRLNTYTVDSQELTATLVLQYRVPADKVIDVYSNLGTSYEAKLESMVIDRFKTVLGQVNATELASKRGEIGRKVLDAVRADAARQYYGLDVTDIQIVNVDWNDAFRQAISNASVAKARVDQQEQEKRQAEADAYAARQAGEAKAFALEAQGKALGDNAKLVLLNWAQRWNGQMPQAMYGENSMTMIMGK